MKRVFLYLVTNLAVMAMLMLIASVLCAFLGAPMQELMGDAGPVLLFAFVFGMGGAHTVDGTEGEAERWLVGTVGELARRANVKMPEVAVYEGDANAFATGAFRDHALVAVSTRIMEQMTREELRAVLGHELSHVANGDMVTMSLVQGVLNTLVILGSHLLASLADGALGGKGERRRRSGGFYCLIYNVIHLLLGVLASLVAFAYSRRREYAADAGSARLLGSPAPMIAALRRLGNLRPGILPDSIRAFGIAGRKSTTSLWSTHPSLEDRIDALMNLPPAYAA